MSLVWLPMGSIVIGLLHALLACSMAEGRQQNVQSGYLQHGSGMCAVARRPDNSLPNEKDGWDSFIGLIDRCDEADTWALDGAGFLSNLKYGMKTMIFGLTEIDPIVPGRRYGPIVIQLKIDGEFEEEAKFTMRTHESLADGFGILEYNPEQRRDVTVNNLCVGTALPWLEYPNNRFEEFGSMPLVLRDDCGTDGTYFRLIKHAEWERDEQTRRRNGQIYYRGNPEGRKGADKFMKCQKREQELREASAEKDETSSQGAKVPPPNEHTLPARDGPEPSVNTSAAVDTPPEVVSSKPEMTMLPDHSEQQDNAGERITANAAAGNANNSPVPATVSAPSTRTDEQREDIAAPDVKDEL